MPHRDPHPFGFAQGRLRGFPPLDSPFFSSLLGLVTGRLGTVAFAHTGGMKT